MNILRALAGSATLLALSSCQSVTDTSMRTLDPPVLAGDKPFLQFHSYFFTAPENFDIKKFANSTNGAGIYSAADGEKLVKMLQRKRGVELVAAPSLTSLPGREGTVEIIREFIYPTEYTPPKTAKPKETINFAHDQIDAGAFGSFPVTPSTPSAFEKKNLGITANYEGKRSSTGNITFTYSLERASFLGLVNYGSPIMTTAKDAFGRPVQVTLTENRIEQPVFDTKRVGSTVTLSHGQFVFAGNLRSDEQPALKKLLPSNKKNLELEKPMSFFALIQVQAIEPSSR